MIWSHCAYLLSARPTLGASDSIVLLLSGRSSRYDGSHRWTNSQNLAQSCVTDYHIYKWRQPSQSCPQCIVRAGGIGWAVAYWTGEVNLIAFIQPLESLSRISWHIECLSDEQKLSVNRRNVRPKVLKARS